MTTTRTRRHALGLLVTILALAPVTGEAANPANALSTALVFRTGNAIACMAQNAGSRDLEVDIAIVNDDGIVVLEGSVVLAPGRGEWISVGSGVGSNIVYCRFTVTQGLRPALRGSYCLLGGPGVCLVTGDAR